MCINTRVFNSLGSGREEESPVGALMGEARPCPPCTQLFPNTQCLSSFHPVYTSSTCLDDLGWSLQLISGSWILALQKRGILGWCLLSSPPLQLPKTRKGKKYKHWFFTYVQGSSQSEEKNITSPRRVLSLLPVGLSKFVSYLLHFLCGSIHSFIASDLWARPPHWDRHGWETSITVFCFWYQVESIR